MIGGVFARSRGAFLVRQAPRTNLNQRGMRPLTTSHGNTAIDSDAPSNYFLFQTVEQLALCAQQRGEQKTVLYFTAPWCPPHATLTRAVQQYAREFPEYVFVEVNIDEHRPLYERSGLGGIPSFVFCEGGRVVNKVREPRPPRGLRLHSELTGVVCGGNDGADVGRQRDAAVAASGHLLTL